MSFEITDGRTPPTVTLSVSPSYDRDFSFPQNAPMMVSAERFKDVSNLKVNQRRSRSFTPVKGSFYLRSPELSPIGGVANNQQHTPKVNTTLDNGKEHLTPGNFKMPQLMIKTIKSTTPTGTPNIPQKYLHHRRDENYMATLSTDFLDDPDKTQNLDKSAAHGYLNHNLEVRLVLKNARMQQYIKAFNKEKIDFGKFLTLSEEDLIRLGVKRKLDRKIITGLINDFNAN